MAIDQLTFRKSVIDRDLRTPVEVWNFRILVPGAGIEPARISPFDFKSNAYTSSAIRAF